MFGRVLFALAKIARVDTALIVATSLGVPLAIRTHDVGSAIEKSLPLFAISMCGFILNDLHDVERDQINHPDRPLPRSDLTETAAAIAYFVLLAMALVSVRTYLDASRAFLYVLLLVALINYNYVVTYFGYLKNVYVAFASTIPVVIVSTFLDWEDRGGLIAAALFSFVLGREMLMDVLDVEGDTVSLAKVIGFGAATATGFLLAAASVTTLLLAAPNQWAAGLATAMIACCLANGIAWTWASHRRLVVQAMKAQFVLGIGYMATV